MIPIRGWSRARRTSQFPIETRRFQGAPASRSWGRPNPPIVDYQIIAIELISRQPSAAACSACPSWTFADGCAVEPRAQCHLFDAKLGKLSIPQRSYELGAFVVLVSLTQRWQRRPSCRYHDQNRSDFHRFFPSSVLRVLRGAAHSGRISPERLLLRRPLDFRGMPPSP